jgi:hypothetical protein
MEIISLRVTEDELVNFYLDDADSGAGSNCGEHCTYAD